MSLIFIKLVITVCDIWNIMELFVFACMCTLFLLTVVMCVQFRPLEQLMGVFPAASSAHVPAPWAELMSDPVSMKV